MDYFKNSQKGTYEHPDKSHRNLFIPSNAFKFDTKWFEHVDILKDNGDSSINDTEFDEYRESTAVTDDTGRNKESYEDGNKALAVAPPRKMLKALEDKIALEQSGQFVVGANLDSGGVDIFRDPMGLTTHSEKPNNDNDKYSGAIYRESFSKYTSTNLEGTRKRQSHFIRADPKQPDSHESSRKEKMSILNFIVAFFQAVLMYIGKFEKFLQQYNLFPNYKYTILDQLYDAEKINNQTRSFEFHSNIPLNEDSSFEVPSDNCSPRDMQFRHQRCIVRILSFLLTSLVSKI